MNVVERADLVSGREYYIECLTQDNSGNITRNLIIEKLIGTFDRYREGWSHFHHFRGIKQDITVGYDVQLGTLWNFYEVKKHRIQSEMESRALVKIMRKITGDEWFLPFN
jgi:hypothetical protein